LLGAQRQRTRKKRRSEEAPNFPIGTEAIVQVVRDESRRDLRLGKSGVVKDDSLVLMFAREVDQRSEAVRIYNRCLDAIEAADPDGIDVLLKKKEMIRIQSGTKVRVIVPPTDLGTPGLYVDRRGFRAVRITDGQAQGKAVFIPARNLRAGPREDAKDK
jgi:hypothetical protein